MHRSFRRAATELNLSPSSLSHTMRTLERNLGVRLLNRTTRSVSPTEAGERLLARLAPALQDLDLALAEVDVFRSAPAGTVRINAPEGAAVMLVKHVVPVMMARYPDVAIDLVTEDRLVDIVAERFDAGVRLGESVPQDMVGVHFGGKARFVAVASPLYIDKAGLPKTPDDLSRHACIRYRLPSGKIYRWEFEKQGQQIAIDVPGTLTLDHMALMLDAASRGLGIAFVLERAIGFPSRLWYYRPHSTSFRERAMRKIVAQVFISLDGVMQAPGGPEEDPVGGFKYGGWTFPYFDEESGAALGETFAKPFDLLLGRKTYDIFASYWPHVSDDDPIAYQFNRVRKYVATRADRELEWNNSQTLGGDVVASLREIKKGEGPDLLIQGSSDFLQTLLSSNMIDEFNLLIFPLLLGKGKRLFGAGTAPAEMKLVTLRSFPSGVIMAKYEPAGEVKTGSFALQDPSPKELERRRNLQ